MVVVPISADRTSMGDIAVKEAEVRRGAERGRGGRSGGGRSQGRSCGCSAAGREQGCGPAPGT